MREAQGFIRLVAMSNSNWETAFCPLCGPKPQQVLYSDCRDRLHGMPGKFTYVRCAECSLVFMNPRPTETAIATYYPSDYSPFSIKETNETSLPVLGRLLDWRFPTPRLGVTDDHRVPRV